MEYHFHWVRGCGTFSCLHIMIRKITIFKSSSTKERDGEKQTKRKVEKGEEKEQMACALPFFFSSSSSFNLSPLH